MRRCLIIKLVGGIYTVYDLDSREVFEAKPRGKFRKMVLKGDSDFHKSISKRTKKDIQTVTVSPKVGDICHVNVEDDVNVIYELEPRINELSRPDLANISQIILIFSVIEPLFSFNLLDKFLVNIYKNKIKPVLIITKIDLVSETKLNNLKNDLKYYENMGIDIYYINNLEALNKDIFHQLFKEKISVLAGQTGVGKSSFLNILVPDLNLKTAPISTALGRGKHTTRHSELFEVFQGWIADTPGFSSLEFDFYDFKDLKFYYPDFDSLKENCRFKSSCNHILEPGCEIKAKYEYKRILPSRYENYLLFIEELKTKKEIY